MTLETTTEMLDSDPNPHRGAAFRAAQIVGVPVETLLRVAAANGESALTARDWLRRVLEADARRAA
jgi:hypothetical protein